MNYRFDDGKWKIEAGINGSTSGRERPNPGQFAGLTSTVTSSARVSLLDLTLDRPRTIAVYNDANQPIDIYNIANYRVTGATEAPYDNHSGFKAANLSARRRLPRMRCKASSTGATAAIKSG